MVVDPKIRRRTRSIPGLSGKSTAQRYFLSEVKDGLEVVGPFSLNGTQITESEGHPWNNRDKAGFQGDIGGAFFTRKSFVRDSLEWIDRKVKWRAGWGTDYFTVTRYPVTCFPSNWPAVPSSTTFPPHYSSSDSELQAKGTTAISRCKPTNSVANLSVAIGELAKDGLPSIPILNFAKERFHPNRRKRDPQSSSDGTSRPSKKAADEFLNYQFGISPLVQDITKFVKGVSELDRIIKQFERDAGKLVRRRYYFPKKIVRESETLIQSGQRTFWGSVATTGNEPLIFDFPGAKCYRTRVIETDTWFSGAFTYVLPTGIDSREKISEFALRADRLGLELTPETIWNLAPWSWAIDWVSNTGDYLSNVSAATKYGLLLRYGYIMETVTVTDTYQLKDTVINGKPVVLPPSALVTLTKRRLKATPFGFGVNLDTLSGMQSSILVALGLSKRR